MISNLKTSRLVLNPLSLSDVGFMYELLNTAGWIKFIGDRNIQTQEDAQAYVQKIIDNPNIHYWLVMLQEVQTPVGIITFIKRDYLDHNDIGFAFLPEHAKHGYAYEATLAVLNEIIKDKKYSKILATTIEDNRNSIQLLEKIGFTYSKKIEAEKEPLLLYSIETDKLHIDNLTETFFSVFTNINGKPPELTLLHSICIPETIIIKKSDDAEVVYTLHTFIEPRKVILSDGTLTEFEESETEEETKIIGNIAQRYSKYQKSGYLKGKYFREYGINLFQFIKTKSGWKVNSVIWEDEKV